MSDDERTPTTHGLKTDPEPFEEVWCGRKRAEYRLDDRGYAVGDVLCLREHDRRCRACGFPLVFVVPHWPSADAPRCEGVSRGYTGRAVLARITHITRRPYVPHGFAMLSIEVTGRLG